MRQGLGILAQVCPHHGHRHWRCVATPRYKNNRVANCRSGGGGHFQYALKTRAGSECVAHVLQHLTDLDILRATVVSVDGIGVFDLVSRNAMLRGVLNIEDGGKVLPFGRMFHAQRSIFFWEKKSWGCARHSTGGGEQGDPLMPLLFSLAALVATQEQLRPGEFLFAFTRSCRWNFSTMHTFQFIWKNRKRAPHCRLQPGTWTQQQPSGEETQLCQWHCRV